MRSGAGTVDGRPVDAYDAEFSLKRLFILGKSYGPLGDLLCGPAPLKNQTDPCPGLRVLDSGRTLAMRFSEKKDFLFHALTDISYAVIPRGSVSAATLAITDYRNTSGPYYVSADPGGGTWRLAANPLHHRYSRSMPQVVRAVPLKGLINNDQALARLDAGEFDYLMNNLVKNPADKLAFAGSHQGYSIHITQPVRLLYVVFTRKGLRRLTKEERFFISRKLRQVYLAGRPMCTAPYQFFRMEGALTRAQLEEVKTLLETGEDRPLEKSLTAGWLKQYLFRQEDDLSEWLPGLATNPPAGAIGTEAGPDFFLNAGDAGFQDDIGLIANYLTLPFFDLDEDEKKRWFKGFVSAAGKKERNELLRGLQYRTLESGKALPVALMPYASLARKPWKFNYPATFGSDNLWRLRR